MKTLKIDLLFNTLISVTVMFMVILLILKTEVSKPAVEDKNRLIVTTDWKGSSDFDIDLWIRDPAGRHVGYSKKKGEGIVLQRDDTGFYSDKILDSEGNESFVLLNREILNLRKLIPGRYTVNVIVYSTKGDQIKSIYPEMTNGPVEIVTELIQADPFEKWEGKSLTLSENCQEFTVLAFDVSPTDEVKIVDDAPQIDMHLPCIGNLGTGEL